MPSGDRMIAIHISAGRKSFADLDSRIKTRSRSIETRSRHNLCEVSVQILFPACYRIPFYFPSLSPIPFSPCSLHSSAALQSENIIFKVLLSLLMSLVLLVLMSSHQILINVILQQTPMAAWLHHQKVLVWLMTQSPIRSISLTHASKHQIFQVSYRDNRHLLRVVAGQINDPSPGYVNGIGPLAQFNSPSGLAISS
jgi:hypothetical protein